MPDEISRIARSLESGDLDQRSRLAPLLAEAALDPTSPIPHLFAFVARHSDVEAFAAALDKTTELHAARRLLVSLGLTLSPRAIPLLLRYAEVFDDRDLD